MEYINGYKRAIKAVAKAVKDKGGKPREDVETKTGAIKVNEVSTQLREGGRFAELLASLAEQYERFVGGQPRFDQISQGFGTWLLGRVGDSGIGVVFPFFRGVQTDLRLPDLSLPVRRAPPIKIPEDTPDILSQGPVKAPKRKLKIPETVREDPKIEQAELPTNLTSFDDLIRTAEGDVDPTEGPQPDRGRVRVHLDPNFAEKMRRLRARLLAGNYPKNIVDEIIGQMTRGALDESRRRAVELGPAPPPPRRPTAGEGPYGPPPAVPTRTLEEAGIKIVRTTPPPVDNATQIVQENTQPSTEIGVNLPPELRRRVLQELKRSGTTPGELRVIESVLGQRFDPKTLVGKISADSIGKIATLLSGDRVVGAAVSKLVGEWLPTLTAGARKQFDKYFVWDGTRVNFKEPEEIRKIREEQGALLRDQLMPFFEGAITDGLLPPQIRDRWNNILQRTLTQDLSVEQKEQIRVLEQTLLDVFRGDLFRRQTFEKRQLTFSRMFELFEGVLGPLDQEQEQQQGEVARAGINIGNLRNEVAELLGGEFNRERLTAGLRTIVEREVARLEASNLTPEAKRQIQQRIYNQMNRQVVAALLERDDFIPYVAPDGRVVAEEGPLYRYARNVVQGGSDIIESLRGINPTYRNVIPATLGVVGRLNADTYGIIDLLLQSGIGVGTAIATDEGIRRANTFLTERLGIPELPAGIRTALGLGAGVLAGGALGTTVAQATGGLGGLTTIQETPVVVPNTIEVKQQEEKSLKGDRSKGVGTLRPKFIVPGVNIFEPSPEEKEADFDEFSAFDFVVPTSEGAEGTIATNPLKRQDLNEERIRYAGAGVDMPNVYGKYPPYNTKEERNLLLGPELPEMTFEPQVYDLGRYDVNNTAGYDWNGDRLAIEMLNPYRFGTRVEQNSLTMPTSILYSVVP
jgi:hypothetical protein